MKDDLLFAAKNGDNSAFAELTKKYAPLIDSMTEKYFRLCDGTAEGYEDLRQEGFLAFYRALLSFDCEQDKVSFGLYAKICMRNRMVSILRKSRSEKKHNTKAEKLGEAVSAPQGDSMNIREISAAAVRLLTKYEKTVFYMYLDGKSYRDIALSLGRNEKSVDNALFRAKAKLRSGYNM